MDYLIGPANDRVGWLSKKRLLERSSTLVSGNTWKVGRFRTQHLLTSIEFNMHVARISNCFGKQGGFLHIKDANGNSCQQIIRSHSIVTIICACS
jgi:hypothetical protein